MALLKLDEDQFDILIRDKKIKTDINNKKAEMIKKGIETQHTKPQQQHVPLTDIEDDFILELEKMFESGNVNDVKDILSTYDKKG
jgi:hypothetical protein